MVVFLVVLLCLVAAVVVAFETIPQLQGLRTKILAYILAAGGGMLPILHDVTGYLATVDWTQYMSAKQAAYVVLALGIMLAFYRSRTKAA